MPRLSTWIKPAVVLLAFAVYLAQPQRSAAQSKLHKALETQIETKPLQTEVTVRDAIKLISDKLGTLPNFVEMPLVVDAWAFVSETPDLYVNADFLQEVKLKFPPVPSRMTLAGALRFILANLPSKNATYVVMPDHVLVTTVSATSPERKLQEKVRGVFEKQPLQVALRELSEMAGTTIIVDNRGTEKAKTMVSASFVNDIDLASALRVLTEMAELKVMVLDGVIFVTTAEHVATLRKEHADKTRMLIETKLLTDKIKADPPVPRFFGTGPFFPPPPPAVDPVFDQFWPYSPLRPIGTSQVEPVGFTENLFTLRPTTGSAPLFRC